MAPVTELRLAIPLALTAYKMSWPAAIGWSVLGNLIPVIFLLWFLEKISLFLAKHFYFLNRFLNWLFERTRKKHSAKFERWQELALVILVGIPLPLTGAWTGVLAAFIFGVPAKRAFWLILLGIVIAALIVSLFSLGLINILF